MALQIEQQKEEKKYLKKVLEILKQEIIVLNLNLENVNNEVNEIRKYYYDNRSEIDGPEKVMLETIASQYLSSGELSNKKSSIYKQMLSSPYFGRIDFDNLVYNELEKVYIGISNLIDNDYNFFVNDWRSPIASMFYDFELGKAYYDAPLGKINGNIILKRQYKIKEGKLKYAFDNAINIDDEILQEVLSDNSSKKMKHIVNTIQKEQNAIIRNDDNKTLIVEGPAGSGKTSVGLHHIAYLLYKYRDKITANNILIFSPSDVFSEYIASVLPTLGEDNVYYTGFSEYMHKYLSEYKNTESYIKFLERIFNNQDKDTANAIKFKLSNDFISILDKYVEYISEKLEFKDIKINNILIATAEEINNLYNNIYSKYPPFFRLKKISENTQMKFRHMSSNKYNAKHLSEIVNKKLEINFDYKKILSDMYDLKIVRNELINSDYIINIKKFIDSSKNALENKTINYEDAILLLYLKGKLNGFEKDSNIKYVIVDEAQDYNRIQYEILKNVFDKAKFTILGDANQTVNNLFEYKSINDISQMFSKNDVEYIPLTTTYRNTYEITMFCNKILGLLNNNVINRHGDEPKVEKTIDKKESYKTILKIIKDEISKEYNSIAIITANNDACNHLIKHLKNNGIDCNKNNFQKKYIHVLPIYYAKGMEFDSVIVYDSNEYSNFSKDKKLLYVACTRALHSLNVISEYNSELKGGKNEKILCKTITKNI